MRKNAEFQSKAGLRPRIIRKAVGKCCEWCQALAGKYDYPDDVPRDVYRRHANCNCTVEYDPGVGKRVQDVWSKRWTRAEESGKIERRKEVGTDDESLLKDFVEHPKKWGGRVPEISKISEAFPEFLAEFPRYLGEYTPESLKALLEKIGCTVKPLSDGNYTDTSFEKGGGYKVNFGGDGILMYHPEERSHHGGAYYKLSTGKKGTKHYDLNGNELNDRPSI